MEIVPEALGKNCKITAAGDGVTRRRVPSNNRSEVQEKELSLELGFRLI